MKRLSMWIALLVVVMVVTALVIWSREYSSNRGLMILVWAAAIILLQFMLGYLIVFKNRNK